MSYFVVSYAYKATATAELDSNRPAHRDYLQNLAELRLSGPFVGGVPGALLLFEADDQARVEQIVLADPFVLADCVETWSVREWKPASGPILAHL